MPRTGTGQWMHVVQVEGPTQSVPDPDGGWTTGWAPLDPPTWNCSIVPATQRDLESIGAGTVTSQATHLLNGWYHAGLTTKARVLATIGGVVHTLNLIFVANRNFQCVETDAVAVEVVE